MIYFIWAHSGLTRHKKAFCMIFPWTYLMMENEESLLHLDGSSYRLYAAVQQDARFYFIQLYVRYEFVFSSSFWHSATLSTVVCTIMIKLGELYALFDRKMFLIIVCKCFERRRLDTVCQSHSSRLPLKNIPTISNNLALRLLLSKADRTITKFQIHCSILRKNWIFIRHIQNL